MTHTPGPWKAGRISNQIVPINAPNGDPVLGYSKWDGLAHVFGCDDAPDDGAVVARANARLIAAAPELLAALEGLAECFEGFLFANGYEKFEIQDTPAIVAARAALAKARG